MAELHRRQVGGLGIIEVDANPNASLTGEAGTIALDKTGGILYVNTDGATAWSNALGGSSHVLRYGVRRTGFGPGQFWVANGIAGIDQRALNATDTEAQWPAPVTGTITAAAYTSGAGDNTTQCRIWINGSAGSTFTWTSGEGATTGLSISVTAGDLIALQNFAGSSPDESQVILLIEE